MLYEEFQGVAIDDLKDLEDMLKITIEVFSLSEISIEDTELGKAQDVIAKKSVLHACTTIKSQFTLTYGNVISH